MDNRDFDLGNIQGSASGMDAFFENEPAVVSPHRAQTRPLAPEPTVAVKKTAATRTKVGSLDQLNGFVRVAEDQLVHKSNQDLWTLQRDAKGDFYIERMFDADGGPLKG
jgi:hypothetical protein